MSKEEIIEKMCNMVDEEDNSIDFDIIGNMLNTSEVVQNWDYEYIDLSIEIYVYSVVFTDKTMKMFTYYLG